MQARTWTPCAVRLRNMQAVCVLQPALALLVVAGAPGIIRAEHPHVALLGGFAGRAAIVCARLHLADCFAEESLPAAATTAADCSNPHGCDCD